MGNQSQIDSEIDVRPASSSLRHDVRDLGRALVELVELQSRLLREDLQAAVRRASRAATVLGSAALLALACLPVAVLGLAYVVSWSGLELGVSMLITSLGLVGVAAVLALLSWKRFKEALEPLDRTRDEFRKNFDAIKSSLDGRQ
ncbi:MAG: phage holin family protein [Planctomycetota bacterium]